MKDNSGPYQGIKADGLYRIGADKPTVELHEVGKRGVPRYDGYEKACGQALYTRDISLPGMLYAKVLCSPYARARITQLDTRGAEACPGVKAVLRYDDPEIDGMQLTGSVFGSTRLAPDFKGWALLPIKTILGTEAMFEGQMVGIAVCAESEQIAIEALRLVRIQWEQLPFILDQEQSLRPQAPKLVPGADHNRIDDGRELIVKGSIEKGFAEADLAVEFTAHRDAHLWAGAELPCVIARWRGDRLELWVHEQQPYLSEMILHEQLGIPMNKIHSYTYYQGCSFGERCNPANWHQNGINTLAAILARRVGNPVKLVLDRSETFYGESGDMLVSYCRAGAKRDGTITAVQMRNIFANYMCSTGIEHFLENTSIPNLRCETVTVAVDKAPAWWCRCEQLPNVFCQTLVFDHVAAALGMDPTEVARKNDGCDGHGISWLSEYKGKHGFEDRDSLRECIAAGKEAIQWDVKWHAPGTKRLPNGRMHGIAFTWSHEWDDIRGTGSAAVMIQNDGTVNVIAQHSDIGTNPWTAYLQIVADELGVKYEDVEINPFDLNVGFALMSPDGSSDLCANGNTVKKAAQNAKRALLDQAAEHFQLPADALDVRNSIVFERANPENKMLLRELVRMCLPMHNSAGFWTEPQVLDWAWHTQGIMGQAIETGRPRLCRQAHFIEVEVDTETGEVFVMNVVNVNDVGKAISPESVEGQMYGGTYMGLGRALSEEMVWDPNTGVLLNRNLLDYKYATMLDYPPAKCVYLETGLGHGPYGACGVGEDTATMIPTLLGPAVYNAIGKRIDHFPITPNKILAALGKIRE